MFSLWELFLTQTLIMSKHTTHLSESDLSSTKILLKEMAQDLLSLQLRQLQHKNQIIEEKKERDSQFAILEEELRMITGRDYYVRKYKKNQPCRSSRSGDSPTKEGSLRIHDYYQPTPRKSKRERRKPESRVYSPY